MVRGPAGAAARFVCLHGGAAAIPPPHSWAQTHAPNTVPKHPVSKQTDPMQVFHGSSVSVCVEGQGNGRAAPGALKGWARAAACLTYARHNKLGGDCRNSPRRQDAAAARRRARRRRRGEKSVSKRGEQRGENWVPEMQGLWHTIDQSCIVSSRSLGTPGSQLPSRHRRSHKRCSLVRRQVA